MKCNICDKNFANKSEYHIHRKQTHRSLVTACWNENCKYGDKSCWFIHGEQIQSDNIETTDQQEVTQRLFEIMEKITERLAELEKSNTTTK